MAQNVCGDHLHAKALSIRPKRTTAVLDLAQHPLCLRWLLHRRKLILQPSHIEPPRTRLQYLRPPSIVYPHARTGRLRRRAIPAQSARRPPPPSSLHLNPRLANRNALDRPVCHHKLQAVPRPDLPHRPDDRHTAAHDATSR